MKVTFNTPIGTVNAEALNSGAIIIRSGQLYITGKRIRVSCSFDVEGQHRVGADIEEWDGWAAKTLPRPQRSEVLGYIKNAAKQLFEDVRFIEFWQKEFQRQAEKIEADIRERQTVLDGLRERHNTYWQKLCALKPELTQ